MNIEELLKMWAEDSKIDELHLDRTTVRCASLHSKYLELYSIGKLRLKRKDLALAHLKKDKWLYYNGKMTKAEMDEKGWPYDPWQGLAKPLKTDMEMFLNTDADVSEAKMGLEVLQTYVDACKEILDTIKWRHNVIKNILDFKRFEAGV